MNILVNVLASQNIEICAQASAKINTILHSRPIVNLEEACYLIASVEKVMYDSLNDSKLFLKYTLVDPELTHGLYINDQKFMKQYRVRNHFYLYWLLRPYVLKYQRLP